MAEEDKNSPVGETLTKGSNEVPPLTLGPMGYTGLITLGGQVLEEMQRELRWPQAIHTFKKMEKDASISPALELVEMMISRVDWSVKIPKGYEEQLAPYAEFLEQCMNDMTHDWKSFIKSASTFSRYGFSINEKVYRYRKKENGSKFDDGLVGIHSLPTRSQDSVSEWKFKNKGREISGFEQRTLGGNGELSWDFVNTLENGGGTKFIPRKKYLHFRNNPIKDSPVGTSPLTGCYQAWKLKCAFIESEAIGVAQDANGFKVLYLPPQYMQANASPENKAIFEEYKKIIRNIHQAKESGLILPLITDELGNKMFQFDVQNITGKMSYDVGAIIERYNKEILLCLFADILALGQEGGGSFSLSESKMAIINMSIQSKLDEIKAQLNHDLARQLFELNGWDTKVMPYFDYNNIEKISLDEVSKFVQRVSATGNLPKTPKVINWIMDVADIPYRVDDDMPQEELLQLLGSDTSRSGDGLAAGGLDGTSTGGGSDRSTSNNENANSWNYTIISQTDDLTVVELNGVRSSWITEDWENFKGDLSGA